MAAIPLVIITLYLVVIPLVVSTIMKGKPFQFFDGLCPEEGFKGAWVSRSMVVVVS